VQREHSEEYLKLPARYGDAEGLHVAASAPCAPRVASPDQLVSPWI